MNAPAQDAGAPAGPADPADQTALQRGQWLAQGLLAAARPAAARPAPPGPPDLLLALGDSWFSYWPAGDVLDALRSRHGWRVTAHALAGASLCEMLFASAWRLTDAPPELLPGADGDLIRQLTTTLVTLPASERDRLAAIVVSAGGNDVAARVKRLPDGRPGAPSPVLLQLLRQADTVDPAQGDASLALDMAEVKRLIDAALRDLFVTLLTTLNALCQATLQRTVPIVLHGYAHPVPDGRGAFGQGWLRPAFRQRGYDKQPFNAEVMALLIDRLNAMQLDVIAQHPAEFGHVRHVDLRAVLGSGPNYRDDWQNELHPTIPAGFERVAARFDQVLRGLPSPGQ
jgi:hypothetical protein